MKQFAYAFLLCVVAVSWSELRAQDTGTRITFDQVGVAPLPTPANWSQRYWDPLRKYLGA